MRAVLRAGGVIAYPTEGVYGLGCIATFNDSVQRVIDIKGRSAAKGLILIGADPGQILPWVKCEDAEQTKRLIHCLGSHNGMRARTWIVPAADTAGDLITGGRDTIAVRVTRHRAAAALCLAAGSALVSTSANRSGHAPITRAAVLRREFGHDVDGVLSRATGNANDVSEIFDFVSGAQLR